MTDPGSILSVSYDPLSMSRVISELRAKSKLWALPGVPLTKKPSRNKALTVSDGSKKIGGRS